MFERHSEEFEQGAKLRLAWFVLADSVAAAHRHILHVAQGEPDAAGVHARLDGLLGGESARVGKHDIAGQHTTVLGTELVGDRYPELTQTHGENHNQSGA